MKIQDIYNQYNIMPSLQAHQRRVAGAAMLICQNIDTKVDDANIIMACLLHDMGNIIKFKLDLFPEFLEPKGLAYWQKVKQEYHAQYGDDEHAATLRIAEEIFGSTTSPHTNNTNVPLLNKEGWSSENEDGVVELPRILALIDAISFSNAQKNYESADYGRKIVAYADMRVAPYGVASMRERLADGHARFRIQKSDQDDRVFFKKMEGFFYKIEEQIFAHIPLQAIDITEEKVQNILASIDCELW